MSHVLVVDGDADRRAKLLQALAHAGVPSGGAATVPVSLDGCAALVVDHATAGVPKVGRVPVVLIVEGRWALEHPDIIDSGVRHVVARNSDDDLVTVLRALLTGKPPRTWIAAPVAEERVIIRRAGDKHDAIDKTRAFVTRMEIAERLVANACHIVEELVTNAVYNAPVHDDTGEHLYARKRRSEDVALPSGMTVELTLRTDGERLAISVIDPWGTLPPAVVRAYLAKGFRRGADQVDQKAGGAGLGLYQVFDAASHLVFVIEPKKHTEVTALIEVGGTYRDFALESKSLNVF